MNETHPTLGHLEEQVSELLELAKKLGDENNNMRSQIQHLMTERSNLLDQKEQARSHVDGMISRLRAMEGA